MSRQQNKCQLRETLLGWLEFMSGELKIPGDFSPVWRAHDHHDHIDQVRDVSLAHIHRGRRMLADLFAVDKQASRRGMSPPQATVPVDLKIFY